MSELDKPSRRRFIRSVGTAGVAATAAASGVPISQAAALHAAPGDASMLAAQAAQTVPPVYLFLMPPEAAFIEAAVDTLIPHDDIGPGALDAGVPVYIDRQLAGSYGAGIGTNLQGPFSKGAPEQGYQLPFAPRDIYRLGIKETNAVIAARTQGKSFDALTPAQRDALLHELADGKLAFDSVPSRVFFATLYANTMEGYFCDPAYGGNRGKATWKMIGYPGVGRIYTADIARYRNRQQVLEPKSLSDYQ